MDQLQKKHTIELKELSAILEIKYGDTFLRNGDFYSFLVHIAQKQHYSIQGLYEKPETFLENLVIEALIESEKERFWTTKFSLRFLEQEEIPIQQETAEFSITNMVFELEETRG